MGALTSAGPGGIPTALPLSEASGSGWDVNAGADGAGWRGLPDFVAFLRVEAGHPNAHHAAASVLGQRPFSAATRVTFVVYGRPRRRDVPCPVRASRGLRVQCALEGGRRLRYTAISAALSARSGRAFARIGPPRAR